MRIVKNGGLPDEAGWRSFLEGYFARGLSRGRIRAWIGKAGGEAVATAALRIDAVRKGRGPQGTREGYVMSVYTRPGFRGRGLACQLMSALMAEARALGLRRLVLHPTDDGRPLYASLGFVQYRGVMILRLDAAGEEACPALGQGPVCGRGQSNSHGQGKKEE